MVGLRVLKLIALLLALGAAATAAEKSGELPNGLYADFTTSQGEFTARLKEVFTRAATTKKIASLLAQSSQ